MNKLFSGRWIFTIIVAIVFLLLSLNGRLPVDKVSEVIMLVFYAYFNRSDRTQPDKPEGKGEIKK